ncbi:Uncharacterised protein r2_g532 [Pycnogonum litorale]
MKISVAKTETLLLSRRPMQCTLHVSGVPLKQVETFKYLGVVFTSDGRRDIELDTRIAAAGAVIQCKRQARRFQISICSNPRLWSRTLGNDRKNAIANTSGQNGVSQKDLWTSDVR